MNDTESRTLLGFLVTLYPKQPLLQEWVERKCTPQNWHINAPVQPNLKFQSSFVANETAVIIVALQKLSMLSEQILQNCLIFMIVFASNQGHGFILFVKFTLLLTQKIATINKCFYNTIAYCWHYDFILRGTLAAESRKSLVSKDHGPYDSYVRKTKDLSSHPVLEGFIIQTEKHSCIQGRLECHAPEELWPETLCCFCHVGRPSAWEILPPTYLEREREGEKERKGEREMYICIYICV